LNAIDVRCRIHVNSAILQFAHFDARLAPSRGHDGIRIETEWTDPADERWLDAIKLGVEQFVEERKTANRPVCNTTLVMLRVISHPAVTTEVTVSRHVKTTLQTYFEKYGSAVIKE
jgi:hypothetical protein